MQGKFAPFIPALCLAVLSLGGVAVARAVPQPSAPVLVYSLNGDALAEVIEAGGRMLSPGGLPGSIIAIGETEDFTDRLYAGGATLVLRANAGGCATIQRNAEL